MQLPTIHMNGTSKERLVEALCNASAKLDDAYSALKETAPNGRDYYPQGPVALQIACNDHLDRLARLDAIKADIDNLTIAIDQLGERNPR
jgi:hypothetical protein